MNVCENCFSDTELQAEVRNGAEEEGVCDVCGDRAMIVDVDEFADFFETLLSLFQPTTNGKSIVGWLQDDWHLFATKEYAEILLDYFLKKGTYSYGIHSTVSYVDEITGFAEKWNDVKEEVKSESRFFADLSQFETHRLIKANAVIPKDSKLYRARVIPVGSAQLLAADMGCPPKELALEGRANPCGIPYLYLCKEETTTYYEVRAAYLDKLAVGEFVVKRDLDIIDFSAQMSLYFAYTDSTEDLAHEIARLKLLLEVGKDLSRPMRRFDSKLEYVPTQLICEYCKRMGLDGVQFNSSLKDGGVNVVLFHPGDAECISDPKIVEISQVIINSR